MIIVKGIPVYWGVETHALDRAFLTRATLDEVLPPFRESRRAVRIRISPWHWLHVGVFAYKTEVTPWGIEALPERIGRWGEEKTTPATALRPVEDGPAAEGGPPASAGDGSDERHFPDGPVSQDVGT